MTKYDAMTITELSTKSRELSDILETTPASDDAWSEAYEEYLDIQYILDQRYRETNQDAFNAFYKDHIEGKTFEEIDPEDWDFYSDWHKDMYGYRPRTI